MEVIRETGLGWDASTGTLNYTDEWWDKKIKENDKVKRIRKKQPSIELQEAWYQLFGDAVATGVDVVGPLVNASAFNDTNHVNVEDEDTGAEGSKQCKKISKTSTKPVQMKCTRRESTDQVGKTSIDSVINMMNRMVEEKLIAEYDDLWCFAMTLLEDPVKREFVLNFPADAGRVAWLKFQQKLGK
ncbi:hypothetical protein Tco_1288533 [Tanacetum coccineum]